MIVTLRPYTHDLRESGWQEAALTTSCRFARAYRSRTNLITTRNQRLYPLPEPHLNSTLRQPYCYSESN
ncbi:TPA_asm: hypothetical protein G1328_21525 [Salmonella enterica]|uniref:Uncharacterized protein n=1 Tax=Salmonella enterica TaxID=28901 RepID=A0A722B3X8_SALER|nr:hypothetical protein [Salmonella enterica]